MKNQNLTHIIYNSLWYFYKGQNCECPADFKLTTCRSIAYALIYPATLLWKNYYKFYFKCVVYFEKKDVILLNSPIFP